MKNIFLLIVCLLTGCTGKHKGDSAKDTENQRQLGTHSSLQGMQTFKKFVVIDENGTGKEAFSLLIPSDWSANGKVQWNLNNPAAPATASLVAQDQKNNAQFEVFPSEFLFHSTYPTLGFPVGSRYMGQLVISRVPNLEEAMTSFLVKNYRPSDFKVTSFKTLSGPTQSQGNGVFSVVETGRLDLEYSIDGESFDEVIFASMSKSGIQGSTFLNIQIADSFGLRVPKGMLEKYQKNFDMMMVSLNTNIEWFNQFYQVHKLLVNQTQQSIQAAGQLSQIISQTNNEINEMISDSYWKASKAKDDMASQFSDYIRGVDTFVDASQNGAEVKLPTGYARAFSNGANEYVVTNDAMFDPAGLPAGWTELKAKSQ